MEELNQEDILEILKSEELNPYLINKGKQVFVDLKKIPKDRYLPVNGSYILGWQLTHLMNEAIRKGEELFEVKSGKKE